MSKVTKVFVGVSLALVVAVALGGCTRVRLSDVGADPAEKQVAVPLESAEAVDVELAMGAGELVVTSDALDGDVLEGGFVYRPSDLEPRIDYEVTGEVGDLRIAHDRASFGFDFTDVRSEWDVVLAEDIPMDLRLRMGAGDATLELGRLLLGSLDVQLGAGDCTIDLDGEWSDSLDAKIEAGAGSIELIVPRDVGVRVSGREDGLGTFEADGFIADGNAFINEEWGRTKTRLDISVQRGVGDVRIRYAD